MARYVPPRKERTAAEYDAIKASSAATQARIREAGRDISAGFPTVVDAVRKEKCRLNLREFLTTYMPEVFQYTFSEDHIRIIEKMQNAILKGGKFALAMPRGNGKTSITTGAAAWALLYGHCSFIVIVGSDASSAETILDDLKSELSNNDMLLDDFPEACYPIRKLERIAHRCAGQTCNGESTAIEFSAGVLALPSIAGSVCAGGRAVSSGLTGQLRGIHYKRRDGKNVRPDFIFLDDPQTSESANSLSQCATRERLIATAVVGMGGPKSKISAVMPCTVIRSGDVADTFLDRNKHPEWNGEKTKMLYAVPKNEKLWEEYAKIRADAMRAELPPSTWNEFYERNRAAMDEGARPAWVQRFLPNEISAIQCAMNLRIDNRAVFESEYQNTPLAVNAADTDALTVDSVALRVNGLEYGKCPIEVTKVTAFIDVQLRLLYYCVVGWNPNFGGAVLEYGTYPDQGGAHFTATTAKKTLQDTYPNRSNEACIIEGLHEQIDRLVNPVTGKMYMRPDGVLLPISLVMVDANWGPQTNTVYTACSTSKHVARVLPSRAKSFGPTYKPINEYEMREGDEVGHYWRIAALKEATHPMRDCRWDVNYWKTFVQHRLACAQVEKHAITLPGRDPKRHELFAQHMCSENKIRLVEKGSSREVDQWICPPTNQNHFWDCVVGCAVAASICGVRPMVVQQAAVPNPQQKQPGRSQTERRSIRDFQRIQRNF